MNLYSQPKPVDFVGLRPVLADLFDLIKHAFQVGPDHTFTLVAVHVDEAEIRPSPSETAPFVLRRLQALYYSAQPDVGGVPLDLVVGLMAQLQRDVTVIASAIPDSQTRDRLNVLARQVLDVGVRLGRLQHAHESDGSTVIRLDGVRESIDD
ncbi:hypothetical protein [Kineosporia sp. R_H_3]|uniref:hypothetical protein n=1 Tax=Kineosporia sp. R_H_3 TaxID=1961848 RepID=UPI000B4B27AD|nr:hypothetical protein [Kineosporia sp. R_H_3]